MFVDDLFFANLVALCIMSSCVVQCMCGVFMYNVTCVCACVRYARTHECITVLHIDSVFQHATVISCLVFIVTEVVQIMSGQGTFPLMVNPLVNEGEELSDDEEELTSGWPETDVSNTIDFNTSFHSVEFSTISKMYCHYFFAIKTERYTRKGELYGAILCLTIRT